MNEEKDQDIFDTLSFSFSLFHRRIYLITAKQLTRLSNAMTREEKRGDSWC